MKIQFILRGQLKSLAQGASFDCEFEEAYDVRQAIIQFASKKGESFRNAVLSVDNDITPSILIFCNGRQIYSDEFHPLEEGNEILLMLPIAGG